MGTNALATLQQAAWFLLSCIELRELQGSDGPHTVPDGKSNISKEMARKEGLNLFPPCMIGFRKCADIQFKWFSIWTKVLPDWLKNSDKEYKFRLKKICFWKELCLCRRARMMESWDSQSYPRLPQQILLTRSLGALQAPTSSWKPFGPLDFVLRALQALRPVRRARLRSGLPFFSTLLYPVSLLIGCWDDQHKEPIVNTKII